MKFYLIAFIVMLLATHQCAFGKKCKVEVNINAARPRAIPAFLHKLPGISILVASVEKLSSIKNTIQPIFEEVKDLIDNGLNDPDIADNIKETYTQLYGAKGTKVGNLIQSISNKLEKGTQVTENLVVKVNQILDKLTKAGQNFVNNGLNAGQKSKCSRAISEAGQKFANTLIENAQLCVKNIIETNTRHIQKLYTIKLEINASIQTGKLRVQIFRDILQEAISIRVEISLSLKILAKCEMNGLDRSLSTITTAYAAASFSCLGSLFGK